MAKVSHSSDSWSAMLYTFAFAMDTVASRQESFVMGQDVRNAESCTAGPLLSMTGKFFRPKRYWNMDDNDST